MVFDMVLYGTALHWNGLFNGPLTVWSVNGMVSQWSFHGMDFRWHGLSIVLSRYGLSIAWPLNGMVF